MWAFAAWNWTKIDAPGAEFRCPEPICGTPCVLDSEPRAPTSVRLSGHPSLLGRSRANTPDFGPFPVEGPMQGHTKVMGLSTPPPPLWVWASTRGKSPAVAQSAPVAKIDPLRLPILCFGRKGSKREGSKKSTIKSPWSHVYLKPFVPLYIPPKQKHIFGGMGPLEP